MDVKVFAAAEAHYQRGEIEDAKKLMRDFVKEYPAESLTADAWNNLAYYAFQQARFEEAFECLTAAEKSDPDFLALQHQRTFFRLLTENPAPLGGLLEEQSLFREAEPFLYHRNIALYLLLMGYGAEAIPHTEFAAKASYVPDLLPWIRSRCGAALQVGQETYSGISPELRKYLEIRFP